MYNTLYDNCTMQHESLQYDSYILISQILHQILKFNIIRLDHNFHYYMSSLEYMCTTIRHISDGLIIRNVNFVIHALTV